MHSTAAVLTMVLACSVTQPVEAFSKSGVVMCLAAAHCRCRGMPYLIVICTKVYQ